LVDNRNCITPIVNRVLITITNKMITKL